MYTTHGTLRRKQARPVGDAALPPAKNTERQHIQRVRDELRSLGMSRYGLVHAEVGHLAGLLHPDEHLGGVVYGHYDQGFAILAATDRRIIFVDAKPLFVTKDELTYYVVSGLSFGRTGIRATVTLHTRVADYTIHTYNKRCAEGFVAYIESRCLEHHWKEVDHSTPT